MKVSDNKNSVVPPITSPSPSKRFSCLLLMQSEHRSSKSNASLPAGALDPTAWVCFMRTAPKDAECKPEKSGIPLTAQVDTEALASRVAEVASKMRSSATPNNMVMSFVGGELQGLVCTLFLERTQIQCRLRSDSAVLRSSLKRIHEGLSQKLAGLGLCLTNYEVLP